MFFSNWSFFLRVIVVGASAYILLVALLRFSGKRTLSQLNVFDFVVTVALGSTLATTILNTSIGLADGILALFILIFLQLAVAWLSVRSNVFKKIVKSEPCFLFQKGEFLEDAMRQERVRKEEVLQAVRSQGINSLAQVDAVVLETNGNISVIRQSQAGDLSAMENVSSY
jgi:uncharacterized membrane protein YcaP (DUF421 family)